MPSSNAIATPPSTSRLQLSTVNSQFFCPNSFRITYIHKNPPANPYGSNISKTKDLKSFRITYFQKKGTGGGVRAIGALQEDGHSVRIKPPVTSHQSPITACQSPTGAVGDTLPGVMPGAS